MARLTNEQLMSLLAVISTLVSSLVQLLHSCATVQTLLIEEYNRREALLKDMLTERNRCFRRYIRRRERFLTRRPRRNWVNPGRTDQWWDNLLNNRMPEDDAQGFHHRVMNCEYLVLFILHY